MAEETGDTAERAGTVLTLVCLNCGKEYYSETGPLPADQVCERCGGAVFRSFFSAAELDEVQQDFVDETGRNTLPEDPGTDIAPGDLHDLNNP